MKYLKKYELFGFFSKEEGIKRICQKYGIKNYIINNDGSIDVDGDVYLRYETLTEFPLKFRSVSGYFDCMDNKLTSLKGCPESVGGHFCCEYNNLTSLRGCPKSVGGGFYCNNNNLTSLEV